MSRQVIRQSAYDGLLAVPNVGRLFAAGTEAPADGQAGYAPGCLFVVYTSGTPAGQLVYLNEGTAESCDFNPLVPAGGRVNVTAATLVMTRDEHENKVTTINRAAGCTVTLPPATGSGAQYNIVVGTTVTSNAIVMTRATGVSLFGNIYQLADNGSTLAAYEVAGSTTITLNGSTQGGIKGDHFRLIDMAPNEMLVIGHTSATGTEVTPLS
jgi:hypothetical protein